MEMVRNYGRGIKFNIKFERDYRYRRMGWLDNIKMEKNDNERSLKNNKVCRYKSLKRWWLNDSNGNFCKFNRNRWEKRKRIKREK